MKHLITCALLGAMLLVDSAVPGVVSAAGSQATPRPVDYTIVDVGIPQSERATGINKDGDVVGGPRFLEGGSAFLWHAGQASSLGSLGGGASMAFGLNELGHVVGMAEIPSTSRCSRSSLSPRTAPGWATAHVLGNTST